MKKLLSILLLCSFSASFATTNFDNSEFYKITLEKDIDLPRLGIVIADGEILSKRKAKKVIGNGGHLLEDYSYGCVIRTRYPDKLQLKAGMEFDTLMVARDLYQSSQNSIIRFISIKAPDLEQDIAVYFYCESKYPIATEDDLKEVSGRYFSISSNQ